QSARRTAIPPPATMWAKRPDAPRASLNAIALKATKVKFQAKGGQFLYEILNGQPPLRIISLPWK
ncbi:hypothetical protein, partial [Streptomyces sp. H39-C1]|uniref:hypothetical protein n=1 Tax=Streptomyces sp. H39-C1 TaxID=3004355 RepID=UPI0022AEEEF7